MATFDQRGQSVGYQFNIAGDINFNSVQDKVALVVELRKLQLEVERASQAGVFKKELAQQVASNVNIAVIRVEQAAPDKKGILDHLVKAKALLEGISSAAGLVSALVQAASLVRGLF